MQRQDQEQQSTRPIYKTKHRDEKGSVKDDKRRHYEDLAIRAEAVSDQRNMKEVYDITRQLSRKSTKSEKPIKIKMVTPLIQWKNKDRDGQNILGIY